MTFGHASNNDGGETPWDDLRQEMASLRVAMERVARRLEPEPASTSPHQLYPIKVAAKRLGISKNTLRRRIADKVVHPTKLGGRTMVSEAEIQRLTRPEEPHTAPRRGGGRRRVEHYDAKAEAAAARALAQQRRRR